MLSWAFRNRSRLQRIYGTVSPPPLAGKRFAAGGAPVFDSLEGSPGKGAPGSVRRAGRAVVARPMPKRALPRRSF